MTITAEARATLTAALAAKLAGYANVTVTATRPVELAAPAVYVDVAARRLTSDDGAPVVVVTFPVVAIVDGDDPDQVAALDDLGDDVWAVALEESALPVAAVPGDVDVDGPRLRSLITSIDVTVDYLTLCPDPVEVSP